MQRIKPHLPAISIFCTALLVRLVYNLTVARDYYPLHDSLAFQYMGFNMIDEHCFCIIPHITTVARPPLWPLIIAGISLIFGRANIYDRLFFCCIGTGTCLFIYLFARDLFNKRIGLIAGLIASVYPALYIYDGWMYSESLYTFLLITTCYCVYRIQRDGGKSKLLWIICGALVALLTLTRANGIVVLGLVILWAIFLTWRKLPRKRVLIGVALATSVAFALILPWTYRNYLVTHSFVLAAGDDGTVLLGAYNDQVMRPSSEPGLWIRPQFVNPQLFKPFPVATCNAACEVTREGAEKAAAIQWIGSHRKDIPKLMVYHLRNFWTPYIPESDLPIERIPGSRAGQAVIKMSKTFPIVIFLLAALGLVATLKRYWRELLFAYLVILSTLGEILVYYGSSRFRAPIEPLLVLLAAGGIWWLTQDAPGTLRWCMKQYHQQQQPMDSEQPMLQKADKA